MSEEVETTAFWTGIGAIIVTPVIGLILIMLGIFLIIAWPIIPLWVYYEKKREIEKINRGGA